MWTTLPLALTTGLSEVEESLVSLHTGLTLRSTTDNGSNFIKAFKVFGEDENNNVVEHKGGDESAQSEDQEDDVDEDKNKELIDTAAHLNEDDGFEFQLPKHNAALVIV